MCGVKRTRIKIRGILKKWSRIGLVYVVKKIRTREIWKKYVYSRTVLEYGVNRNRGIRKNIYICMFVSVGMLYSS